MDDNWQFVEGLGDHDPGIVFQTYEFLHANPIAAISNKARKERKGPFASGNWWAT
jgi:hypothetical protein